MPSGDVVNGIGVLNTNFSFQPAVGVSVCITMATCNTQWTSLYNGTTESRIWITNQTDPAIGAIHKLMINNTNYLLMIADPTYVASYTGIVI